MSFGAAGLSAAGTALGMMSSLFEGQSKADNALLEYEGRARQFDAQADADTFNAKVARQLAQAETDKAAADASDYSRTNSAKLASMRALGADSGIDLLSGSPLMVTEAIFAEMEFGRQRIAGQGQVASTRQRNQATLLDVSARNNRSSAQFARKAGEISADNIRKASYINAASAGVKGAGSLIKDYDSLLTRGSGGWGDTVGAPLDIRPSAYRYG